MTDSVKFLNEKCLLSCNIAVHKGQLEHTEYAPHIREDVRRRLGRMLGELAMAEKATVSEEDRFRQGERVFSAEVYILSIADMQRLYSMVRDEAQREQQGMATPAVIEAVKVLLGDPDWYWGADAANFADELITRLKGDS